MAKAPAPAAEAEAPKKKSSKLLIIILIVVLLLLIAIGGVVALLLLKKGGSHDEAAPAAEAAAHTPAPVLASGVDLTKPPVFVALEPFVVNLAAGEGDRLLQVVMEVRVLDATIGDGIKGFMPEIRHRVNLILRSKLPSDLATPEGQQLLADEVAEAMNKILGFAGGFPGQVGIPPNAPVQSVLFNSFIIQ